MLDLIEKKRPAGLLVLLDDECKVPRGSWNGWLNKCKKAHGAHARFAMKLTDKECFTVVHYAGEVRYDAQEFLMKNKDKLFGDAFDLMKKGCTLSVIQKAFGAGTARDAHTQGGFFRSQLRALIANIDKTSPYYIRCIKPNMAQKPNVFESRSSLHQLHCAGIFEALQIRREGFPFRYGHREFFHRFAPLAPAVHARVGAGGGGAAGAEACRALLAALGQAHPSLKKAAVDCKIGTSMVLYRSAQHHPLELERCIVAARKAVRIQAFVRGGIGRAFVAEMRRCLPILRAAIQARDRAQLKAALEEASGLVYEVREQTLARNVLAALEEEARLNAALAKLDGRDPEAEFDAFKGVVDEVLALRAKDPHACENTTSDRVIEQFESVAKRRACAAELMRAAAESEEGALRAGMADWEALKAKNVKISRPPPLYDRTPLTIAVCVGRHSSGTRAGATSARSSRPPRTTSSRASRRRSRCTSRRSGPRCARARRAGPRGRSTRARSPRACATCRARSTPRARSACAPRRASACRTPRRPSPACAARSPPRSRAARRRWTRPSGARSRTRCARRPRSAATTPTTRTWPRS